MKAATFALAATVVATMLLVRVVLLYIDAGTHESYQASLVELRTQNARVNETVLKVRLGLIRNADPLAEMMRSTAALHRELRRVPSFLAARDQQRVQEQIDASARLQIERQKNVERFVAEDAALAASLRILAPETIKLASDVEAVGGRLLADHARTLRVEVLELAAAREQGHIAAIHEAIVAIRKDDWRGEREHDASERLIAHVNNVVLRRQRVDALTGRIVTPEAVDLALAIEATYAAGVEAARSAWQRTLTAFFLLTLVIVASTAWYVIHRLRAAGQQLGAASERLTQAMEQLQAERAKDKELADLKSRFVSMTSHEFRTPLSVISSSAELLQNYGERWAKEKRSEHLARIRSSVIGMTKMLDRVLLIGKSEAKMLEFLPLSVRLDLLCDEILQAIALADGGRHRMAIEISPEIGTARADAKLVRHILENLLSNALKYSPEGTTVWFSAERDGAMVEFTVEDSGIGIPVEDQSRLFEGFHRARNATHISGTGLGLPVVQQATILHGGVIELESSVGEGSTFRVRIRAERDIL